MVVQTEFGLRNLSPRVVGVEEGWSPPNDLLGSCRGNDVVLPIG